MDLPAGQNLERKRLEDQQKGAWPSNEMDTWELYKVEDLCMRTYFHQRTFPVEEMLRERVGKNGLVSGHSVLLSLLVPALT